MPDPLEVIWRIADIPQPVFTAGEVSMWPEGTFEQLREIGLLQQADTATHVACSDCPDRHIEELIRREGANGETRFYLMCPEAGRVAVAPEQLIQWTIDIERVPELFFDALGLSPSASIEDIETGRAWLIGYGTFGGQKMALILARGLGWDDGPALLSKINSRVQTQSRIVFTWGQVPQPLPGTIATVPLDRVLGLGGGKARVNTDRIEAAIPDDGVRTTNKPIVDGDAFSITWYTKTCRFDNRSKLLFRLFERLNRRPGLAVRFTMMRQVGDVWDGRTDVTDATIRGAVKRLRDKLRRDGLSGLADSISTGSDQNDPYAILDLSTLDSNSN